MNQIIKSLERQQKLTEKRYMLAQKWLEQGRGHKQALSQRYRHALGKYLELTRAIEALRRIDSPHPFMQGSSFVP